MAMAEKRKQGRTDERQIGEKAEVTPFFGEKNRAETVYFACGNTAKGFISEYRQLTEPVEGGRLYIIKGGPGTGKSYLMEQVAREGQNRGMTVEKIPCSSDPYSLDGVRLTDPNSGRQLTVVDGTAPHTCDPTLPGSYDEIVNLGDFWKGETLRQRQGEIARLNGQKAALYRLAYRYLAAAGGAHREVCGCAESCYLSEKAEKAIGRILAGKKDGKGRVNYLFTESVGMAGAVQLPTLFGAEQVYAVEDRYGIGGCFMTAVLDAAAAKGCDITVARSLLDPDRPSGIRIGGRSSAIAFLLCDRTGLTTTAERITADAAERGVGCKVINLARFLDSGVLTGRGSALRQRYRFAAEMRKELLKAALGTFAEIKKVHFALEEIYGAAMDFPKKEAFTKKLLIRLFGEM